MKNYLLAFLSSDKRLKIGGLGRGVKKERQQSAADYDNPLRRLYNKRVLSDVEVVSLRISRSLFPTILKLERSHRREELKRLLTANHFALSPATGAGAQKAHWMTNEEERGIWHEG